MSSLTIVIPACPGCCGVPPLLCHDLYGDSLTVAISGVTECVTTCFTVDGVDYSLTYTDVNGVFTAIYDSMSNLWKKTLPAEDNFTLTQWTSTDGTCTGDPTILVDEGPIELLVSCSNNFFLIGVRAAVPTSPFATVVAMFLNDGLATIGGGASANTLACGLSGGTANVGENGHATISL